ncbi:MAG: hypothetical protein ACTSSE_15020 [Candidatus Thorarchaeota archaeon]
MKKYSKPSRFIQVPLTITRVSDLFDVLRQLTPLKTRMMKARIKRFGQIPRDIAFMYLLGALVSDGSFDRRNGTSTSLSMKLSSKYPWSEAFGEAFCYCLGMFGFKAGRISNDTRLNQAGEEIEMMNWKSSASPFMMWVRNTLLGLKLDTPKSNQSLKADWISKMPSELIVPFLQGVADGDGYASPRKLVAGIGTKHNKEYFRFLLNTVGIQPVDSGTGISIGRKKSLKIANELPLFKYADGRLNRLHDIANMLSKIKRTHLTADEMDTIIKLHKQGLGPGEILTTMWAEKGYVRRPRTIQKAIERQRNSERKEKAED